MTPQELEGLDDAEYEVDNAEVFISRMMTFLKKKIDAVPEGMIDDKELLLGRMKDALDDGFYNYIQEHEGTASSLRLALKMEHERLERTV